MQPSPSARPPRTTLTNVNITFLGTASAQPSSTRNHSSIALRLGGDVWLFDCGEATQHQIQRSKVKMGKIEKVFITHTHGDHIFGLLPLLASRLNGVGGTVDAADDTRLSEPPADQPPFEIYGPLGMRAYVRNGLTYTHTLLSGPYVVHELRLPSDPPGDFTALPPHAHEQPGRNIAQAADGTWPNVFADGVVAVSAAPVLHSVPCVGYAVAEAPVPCVGYAVAEAPVPGKVDPARYVPHLRRTGTPMSAMRALQRGESVRLSDGTVLEGPPRRAGRTIAILGDTYDPSPIAELARGADVLVHEATNAYLPEVDPDTKENETKESVQARAMSRGHSTPQMAGAFAARVGARKLVLNHFSPRYAGDEDVNEESRRVMEAIRTLACEEYKGEVVCARDFMSFDVELKP